MSPSARLLVFFCFIAICRVSVASRVDLLSKGGVGHQLHRRSLKQLSCFQELTNLAGVVTSFSSLTADIATVCSGSNATFRNFTGPLGVNVSCPVGGSSPCRCMNKSLELATTGTSLLTRLTNACGAALIRSFLGDANYLALDSAMNRFSLCRDLAGTELRDVARGCNLTCASLAVVGGCNNATFFNQTNANPSPSNPQPPPPTPESCLAALTKSASLIADVGAITAELTSACDPSHVTFTNVTGPTGVSVPCPTGGASPCACIRRTLDLALLSNSSYDGLISACGLSAVRGLLGTTVVGVLEGARGQFAVCERAGNITASALGSIASRCNISCASLRSVGACTGGNYSMGLPWLPTFNRTLVAPCSLSMPAMSGLLDNIGDLSEAVGAACGSNSTLFTNVTSPSGSSYVCPVGGVSPCGCVRRVMELTKLSTSALGFMTSTCAPSVVESILGSDVVASLKDTVTWFAVCDNATRPQLSSVADRCNITCGQLQEVGACGANRTLTLPDWANLTSVITGLPAFPGFTFNQTCTRQMVDATGLLPLLANATADVAAACAPSRVNMTLVRGAGNLTAMCPVGGPAPCACVNKMVALAQLAGDTMGNLAAACGVEGSKQLLGPSAFGWLQATALSYEVCQRAVGGALANVTRTCNLTCDRLQGLGACDTEWPPVAAPAVCDDAGSNDTTLDFTFIFAEVPECALPLNLDATGACPSLTCKGDGVNCCPCLAKVMASLASANIISPRGRPAALVRSCHALKLGACALDSFFQAAAACVGTNGTNSPRLIETLQYLQLAAAGGPLSGLMLDYNERGVGGNPPSPVIAVGPDYAITIVNSQFARSMYRVYMKNSFQPIKQSFLTQFHRSNTICRTGPFPGSPYTLYDHLADIWLIMEVARNATSGEYFLCLIKSLSGVPYGLLFRGYTLPLVGNPGDMSFSLMPDGYYMTTSELPAPAYALDREMLLSAGTLRPMARGVSTTPSGPQPKGLLPAHLKGFSRNDSAYLPLTCGYFVRPIDDELLNNGTGANATRDFMEVWQLCPNFANGTSPFSQVASAPISDFNTTACAADPASPCLRQPTGGPVSRLLSFSGVVRPRASFRSFADYDSLLASFSVDAEAGHGALMWVELRRQAPSATVPSPAWSTYQDGIWSPDDKDRFLGSSEMDRSGNIALGYVGMSDGSAGRRSPPTFPSLYFTGRVAGAPKGQMTENETLLVSGTAAASSPAFGGKSSLAVDPVDGCSFYFLGPWGTTTSKSATRVGMFRFPSCLENSQCASDADCNDGQYCTLDRCRDGTCIAYQDPLLCRFGEYCDEAADACKPIPI